MIFEFAAYSLNPSAVPTALTAGAVLCLGLVVLIRERASLVSGLFLLVTLSIGIWLLAFSAMYCAHDPRVAFWWAKSAYLGVPFIPAAIFHFSVAVLRSYPRCKRLVWLSWALSMGFADAIFLSDAFIPGLYRYWWGYYPRYGWLSIPYLLYFFGVMATCLQLYREKYRKAPPGTVHRERTRAFLIAFSIIALGSVDYLAKYGVPLYPFGYLPVLAFLVLVARAIWRYRLVDLTPTFAAKQLVRTMTDGVMVLDVEGMIRVANATACELFARPQEELVGEFLSAIDRTVMSDRILQTLVHSGTIQRYEISQDAGPRGWRTLHVSASALRDRAEQTVGVICVLKDITDSRRVEEALRVSESRFRRLTQSNVIGIIVADLSGRVLDANDGFLSMTGYTRQDLLSGRVRWDQMTPSEWKYLDERAIAQLRATAVAAPWEKEYIRKDGQRVPVLLGCALLEGSEDQCIAFVLDLTERRRVEEALQSANKRLTELAAIVESSPLAIVRQTLDGIITSWNSGAERLYGYTMLEALGQPMAVVVPPQQAHELSYVAERLKLGQPVEDLETVRIRKDGTLVHVSETVSPIVDNAGRIIGASSIARDISRRKQAEQALKHLNETLEQRVAERSAAAEERARELAQVNVRLETLSLLDPLTELLNRRGLQQTLSQEIQRARREGESLLALLVDLDDFKRVNDTLGYAVGDVVLKEVAQKLREALRATDHVARIGGDEFMVLLPDTRPAEGVRVAEKVRLAVSGSPVWVSSGEVVRVTASFGLVSVPLGLPTLDDLVSHAHMALHESKHAGKNQVFFDHRKSTARVQTVREMRVDILTMLRRGDQLRVVLQPIFRLADRACIGYELLSRLAVETFSMPDDFFRLCLEANMLTQVDHQCFKTCLETAARLPDDVRRHLNLFPSTLINVSSRELFASLPEGARQDPFCIEISEQQIVGDPSYLAKPVEALKRSGVLIAVDDVGFGRTSLESLIFLEPHIIKIDKRCVQGIARDSSRIRSLTRLLQVAQALGTDVVAEGIESPEDLDALAGLGVPYGQGFLLGRPAPLAEFKLGDRRDALCGPHAHSPRPAVRRTHASS